VKVIGGIISIQANGTVYAAKGDWTWNLGRPKRRVVKGSDNAAHGLVEEPQVAFIEGKITDRGDLDMDNLTALKDATVTLACGNGKLVILREAAYAAEGTGNTGEGEVDARFEGASGEEVPA
jgi:hypothetical protein